MPDPSLSDFKDDHLDSSVGSTPSDPVGESPSGEISNKDEEIDPTPVQPNQKSPGNGNGKQINELPFIEYYPYESFESGEYENPEEAGLPALEGDWLEEEGEFENFAAGGFPGKDFVQYVARKVHQQSTASVERPFYAEPLRQAGPNQKSFPLPPLMERRINPRLCSAGMLEEIEFLHALVSAATHAQSEDEAASFVVAMVPGAVRLAPGFARGLWPVVPALIAGIEVLARLFFMTGSYGETEETWNPESSLKQEGAHQYMALIPAILVETVASLARASIQNEPVALMAPAVLAEQVSSILSEAKILQTGRLGRGLPSAIDPRRKRRNG